MMWTELERGYRNMWRELEQLDRSLGKALPALGAPMPAAPATDIRLTNGSADIAIELPGVNPDEVDISVVGRLLTVSGERKPEEAGEGATYQRRECWSGKFSRTFELPFTIDSSKVEARFQNGILKITLAQVEAEKPRRISVMTN